jgi:hypothetical protein
MGCSRAVQSILKSLNLRVTLEEPVRRPLAFEQYAPFAGGQSDDESAFPQGGGIGDAAWAFGLGLGEHCVFQPCGSPDLGLSR